MLIVCLALSLPVADDGSLKAQRTPPRYLLQAKAEYSQIGLVFRMRQCDKQNHSLPLALLARYGPATGLHLPVGFNGERKEQYSLLWVSASMPSCASWPV
jgi:hypothetical protein